ncbi:serine hydrolase domain-containing protein [Tenacibaculum xiamenense]|uniref:serine hydrolase domain-containing protein n=1 Tax=Tenacibaculum xiamenense TaxID=1261553 RepID=UPI0038B66780
MYSQSRSVKNQDVENIISNYKDTLFSGSIFLKKKNEVVHFSSYGYAKREEKITFTNRTLFSIGSIGKMITSVVMMKLYEEGKIALDAPISTYLEDLPKDKQEITIHQLLTHTSGLPNFFTDGDDFKRMSKENAYKKIKSLKLESVPGTKYSYSNTGYNVLAMIVESVENTDYLTYTTSLFKSLGMYQSGFSGVKSWKENEVARGYGFDKKGDNTPNSWPIPSWVVIGTGEVITSTADMSVWIDNLLNYKIVSKESLDKIFHPHVEIKKSKKISYGYGWKVREKEGNKAIYHNGGGDFGQLATVRYYPEEETVLVMISNNFNSMPPQALLLVRDIEQNFIYKK